MAEVPKKKQSLPGEPPRNGVTITPGSSLPFPTQQVFVGTAGDLEVVLANQEDTDSVLLKNIANGTMLYISIKKVLDTTENTASDLVGFY